MKKFYLSISLCSCLLAQDTIILEKVLVDGTTESTTAGVTRGYESITADSVTKTRTPLKEIPKSVQVINSNVMDDQGVQSISEALHNSSGVVTNNPLTTPVAPTL